MRKLLIAITCFICTSFQAYAAKDRAYLRIDAGSAHFQSEKNRTANIKLKSEHNPLMSVAIGYGLMDMLRAELELGRHFRPGMTRKPKEGEAYYGKLKHKPNISSLFLKGIIDIYDFGITTFFAGGGMGIARVSEKIIFVGTPESFTHKLKIKNNTAYTALAGIAFNVSSDAQWDITYSYNSYGTTKSKIIDDFEHGKTRLHAHILKLGVRWNI
ncbi:MAG: adhesin [Rickettsiaceae bacterium]|jgi:opacity protein-like surface antigen|nr:adhesin [Rickettsiaceae bacterium]